MPSGRGRHLEHAENLGATPANALDQRPPTRDRRSAATASPEPRPGRPGDEKLEMRAENAANCFNPGQPEAMEVRGGAWNSRRPERHGLPYAHPSVSHPAEEVFEMAR